MKGKRKLIIIGAGDFSREVLAAALENPACGRDWVLGGFLDDAVDEARRNFAARGIGFPILGTVAEHEPKEENVYLCTIAAPVAKLKICEDFQARGAHFINLLHPTAQVGPRCHLGVGNILMYQAGLTTDVTLGNFVIMNRFSSVGHDAVVGDGCTLNSYCDVTGFAVLGRGVFMGSHASILPGTRVGDFATVGAGSIVLRRVKPGETVLGVPAKALTLPQSKGRK